MILYSDRSKKTVIMDQVTYHNKMMDLLSDSDTYATESCQRSYKDKDLKKITWTQTPRMINAYVYLPRIHGLSKLHKANVPVRPVVDTMSSPAYDLCKFTNNFLESVIQQTKYNKKIRTNSRNSSQTSPFLKVTNGYTNIDKGLFFKILNFCLCQNVWPCYGYVLSMHDC